MSKGPDAFRTISEVAGDLGLPQHVLRFWETRFSQIKPLKRGGGRRYYRPDDVDLLRGIRILLYDEGYTIKGVQRILKEQGARFAISAGRGETDSDDGGKKRVFANDIVDLNEPAAVDTTTDWSDPEIDEDDDAEAAHVSREGHSANAPTIPLLSGKEVQRLKAALVELDACKRLLEQVD